MIIWAVTLPSTSMFGTTPLALLFTNVNSTRSIAHNEELCIDIYKSLPGNRWGVPELAAIPFELERSS